MKRHLRQSLESRRGVAVLAVIMILGLVMLALVGGVARMATYQTVDRSRYETYKDEFAAAENALNASYGRVQFLITNGTPNFFDAMEAMTPPTVAGYEYENFEVDQLFNGTEDVSEGQWQGLSLYRLRYQIDVTSKKQSGPSQRFEHPGVSLRQGLEITYVPLYIFAIFYDPTMEIAPSPNMTVNGRVHANGDAYIGSDNASSTLAFQQRVTIGGDVFHARHPASGMTLGNGEVTFNNGTSQVSMRRGSPDASGWLDSADSDWTNAASERWNNRFQSGDHGVKPLGLPIPTVSDPHTIIERASADDSYSLQQEKFENKAGLKITSDAAGNITGVDSSGHPVALTYPDPANPSLTKSVYKVTTFYDAREGKTVRSIDINLGNMIEGNIKPENGILFVSNEDISGNPGVVRLTNGARLPQGSLAEGFSVATDDAIYIKGDYNTVNKTLSMTAGDALYILSNAWDDTKSSGARDSRVASNTTVNTVCMNGIVPSAGGKYSGGVENYFRFLENWSGKNFTFSGSIISLWESTKFLGKWSGNAYTPPTRIWSWDTALGGINGPPGAPRVVELKKTSWQVTSGSGS